MLKTFFKKIASLFAIGWFATSPNVSALTKDNLPGLPLNELVIKDTKEGIGKLAVNGSKVKVHYSGWLYDPEKPKGRGIKFDSSLDRGQPFQFSLGNGMVIQGWDKGVEGMKEGGVRTLIIPSQMGYGSRGAGGVIPPNAVLMFDVELLEAE